LSKRAVFLDRDGVINEEVNYLSGPEDFRLLPRAAAAIRLLRKHGWQVIVVTNQSGVTRGYYTEADVAAIHERMRRDLARARTQVDAVYFCPHHPDAGCNCRKPRTLLFQQAAADFDLELAASYFVGDKLTDLLPGKALGGSTILVLTGYGQQEQVSARQQGFEPDHIAGNLYGAAQWIIQRDENTVRL
jgi:D-glycero-D-manno-heptose 1,7-bisphosphate phosphatase